MTITMATMMVIAIMAMIIFMTMIHADDDDNGDDDDDDAGDGDGDDVVVRKPTFLSLTDHHSAVESARNLASVLQYHSSGQDHLGFSQPVITMSQS